MERFHKQQNPLQYAVMQGRQHLLSTGYILNVFDDAMSLGKVKTSKVYKMRRYITIHTMFFLTYNEIQSTCSNRQRLSDLKERSVMSLEYAVAHYWFLPGLLQLVTVRCPHT